MQTNWAPPAHQHVSPRRPEIEISAPGWQGMCLARIVHEIQSLSMETWLIGFQSQWYFS